MTLEEIAKAYEAELARITKPVAEVQEALDHAVELAAAFRRAKDSRFHPSPPEAHALRMQALSRLRDLIVEDAAVAIADLQRATRSFLQSSLADSLPAYQPPPSAHPFARTVEENRYVCASCGREEWQAIHRVETDLAPKKD